MPKVTITDKKGLVQETGSGVTIKSELSIPDNSSLDTPMRISANYMRFLTGDYNGLTLVTKTDSNADTGFTFTVNGFHEVAALGDATNALILPSATKDAIVVWAFTGINDGGNNATVTTATGDFYAAQTLVFPTLGAAAAGNIGPRVIGTDITPTQAAAKISTFTAAHNTLTLSTTATNNQSNIGAQLVFYCETKGFWRLLWRGAALGTGVMNATFAGTTV